MLSGIKNKWKKESFSQSGEDLIIRFIFSQIGIYKPSYLDIGAHHPYNLSNTATFYQSGSRGINVEPDPMLYKEFKKHRKSDINLNCGISDKDGELILNVMNVPTLNTFSSGEAEKLVKENNFKILKKIPVKVLSLTSLLASHCKGNFPDFLNLDVEGLDEQIIRSIDFEKSKPIVICLETISYSETGKGIKSAEIIKFIEQKGYMVYADTYINTIFVLKDKWLKS